MLQQSQIRLRKIQTTATTLETNWGSTNNLNMLKEFLQQILKLAKVVFKDVFRNTSKYLRSPLNIIQILQNAQEMQLNLVHICKTFNNCLVLCSHSRVKMGLKIKEVRAVLMKLLARMDGSWKHLTNAIFSGRNRNIHKSKYSYVCLRMTVSSEMVSTPQIKYSVFRFSFNDLFSKFSVQ